MRHTGPLPPYERNALIGGFPERLITPAMLAIAESRQIIDLWRHLMHRVLLALNVGDTARCPPIGTFRRQLFQARNYWDQYHEIVIARPSKYRLAFRPSATFRGALLGHPVAPHDDIPPLLHQAALDAQINPIYAQRVWPLIASSLIVTVARGDSLTTIGIGTFTPQLYAAKRYRNWRTGQIAVVLARTLPTLRGDTAAHQWLDAGVIPDPWITPP